jgi:hypothetical protein
MIWSLGSSSIGTSLDGLSDRKPTSLLHFLHGLVQINSSEEFGARLFHLVSHGVQWAKAPVAVGLEWAHAEFLGEGQSLVSSQMRLRARCTDSYSLG